MTETCKQCGQPSSLLHRRSLHIAVWCSNCADWCQPGKWIPHVLLVQRGINLTRITEAPLPPTTPPHPSLFDAA